jgi:hypothetical protein
MKVAGACLAAVAIMVTAAPQAMALVLGGGAVETDCYAAFDGVNGGRATASCVDGDPSCDHDGAADGVCGFDVRVCVHVPRIRGCRPRRIGDIWVSGVTQTCGGRHVDLPLPALPAARERCGDFAHVTVPLRVRRFGARIKLKYGKAILKMRATSRVPDPQTDRDKLKLLCLPSLESRPDLPACARDLVLTVSGPGSDLDGGWNGDAHNLPLPGGWRLRLPLTGCDATTFPSCAVDQPLDPTFGPPLPVLTAGVPACMVNRVAGLDPGNGAADLQSGAITTRLNLSSSVYLTTTSAICPRCTGSVVGDVATCDSGPNQGGVCTVEGILTVADAPAESRVYALSAACPPDEATFAATRLLPVPLTTGTSTLLGPSPCSSPDTPAVPDDACGDGTCMNGACTECASTTAEGECVAPRGGIQQACCSTDPTRPCFPTAEDSGGKLERIGVAAVPQPAWPDPTYPKIATGAKLVGVFCPPQSETGAGLLGTGPAAVILPVTTEWLR